MSLDHKIEGVVCHLNIFASKSSQTSSVIVFFKFFSLLSVFFFFFITQSHKFFFLNILEIPKYYFLQKKKKDSQRMRPTSLDSACGLIPYCWAMVNFFFFNPRLQLPSICFFFLFRFDLCFFNWIFFLISYLFNFLIYQILSLFIFASF